MALRHEHPDPAHEARGHDVVAETATVREPFGISQALAIAIGVFFIVTGAIGLARTGMENLTERSVEVAGLGMTGLLALIHIAIGLLAAVSAASRGASRSMLLFLGPALIAMGSIALAESERQLGWTDTT